jgi:hypothetical protein
MLAGLAVILYVRFQTPIAWTWYVVIGATTTFGVGWLSSLAIGGAHGPGAGGLPPVGSAPK